jgi:hypothetical protein
VPGNVKMASVALAIACCTAYAEDNTFDPRSVAMGGTGAATANLSNAVFHNAAMLVASDLRALATGGAEVETAHPGNTIFTRSDADNTVFKNHPPPDSAQDNDQEMFTWEFPIIGGRILDDNQLIMRRLPELNAGAGNLASAALAFKVAYANFIAPGGQTQANLMALQLSTGAVGAALGGFSSTLSTIDAKAMSGNAFLGTSLAIPGRKYGLALYLDARVELGGVFTYASRDQQTVNNVANDLSICGNPAVTTTTNYTGCANAYANFNPNGQINLTPQTSLQVRGVEAKDLGIAVAGNFPDLAGLDIGVIPKLTQFATYDFLIDAQSNPKIILNQGQRNYTELNMDLGAARVYDLDSGDQLKAGLAFKDVISRKLITVLGNTIDIKPRATLGAGYISQGTVVGVDLDLIANHPMLAGLTKESQFIRLGAEFDDWRWAQLRIGYRHDLKGNYVGLPSVGVGMSLHGIHFDVGAAYIGKKEAALSLQTGSNF